jgi:cell wall assembly regulator SMI1
MIGTKVQMRFTDSHAPLTPQDIAHMEAKLGLRFPEPVHELYLSANDGIPDPFRFQSESLDTLVAEFLPLNMESTEAAIAAYHDLVVDQKAAPTSFFPFAVDAGGDYFFVDTTTLEGTVYFHRHDTASADPFLNLRIGFEQFWSLLK